MTSQMDISKYGANTITLCQSFNNVGHMLRIPTNHCLYGCDVMLTKLDYWCYIRSEGGILFMFYLILYVIGQPLIVERKGKSTQPDYN